MLEGGRDAVVIEGVLPRVLLHRVLGWCVFHTEELLADWNLVRQGKEPKWIDWSIDRKETSMLHDICMVKPATGRKVDCYFTTGHVKRFNMAPLLKPDCGPAFRPLRNRKTFLSTMTVMNGTLAFDVAGGRNDRKCVDIDSETIFKEGVTVTLPY